jgi:hypothetical protein
LRAVGAFGPSEMLRQVKYAQVKQKKQTGFSPMEYRKEKFHWAGGVNFAVTIVNFSPVGSGTPLSF